MKSLRLCLIVLVLAGAAQAQVMHGFITDAISGKPVPGALITVNEIEKTCTTDSTGYYNTGLVPSGIFNATVSAPDYIMVFRKVFIAWPKGSGLSQIRFNAGLYHKSTNADTAEGKVSLTYRFPGHGDVEIVIKNGISRTVRTMFDRSRIGGIRTVTWDGKDDVGSVLPPGRYRCKVSDGRQVIIRTLEWEGETYLPPAPTAPPPPAENPPAEPSEVPAPAVPAPEETPAVPAE